MPAPDPRLFRRWGHSFEEDREGVTVYRPEEYGFPPARGRRWIELRPDGGYVDWGIGRGDAPERREGRWQVDDDGRLRLTTGTGPERVVEASVVAPDRLEVRTGGGS
jgi:hypothetical protein